MGTRKYNQEAIVVFADLVSSSRISDVQTAKDFGLVILEFQQIAHAALKNLGDQKKIPNGIMLSEGIVRGEEVSFCFVLNQTDANFIETRKQTILTVLEFVFDLSIRWFYSKINIARIARKAAPIRLAIGVHYGKVNISNSLTGSFINNTRWEVHRHPKLIPIGVAINLAKRVETASRLGKSTGIAISQSFLGICREYGLPIFVDNPLKAKIQGFEHSEPVYEIYGQDIVYQSNLVVQKRHLDLVEKAFTRDPNRNSWLIEVAVETLFLLGSTDASYYKRAIDLAELAIALNVKSDQMYWRAAMAYHRRKEASDADVALNYYERAAQDPLMIWAQYDLAAAHWVKSKTTQSTHSIKHLKKSLAVLNKLIQREPRQYNAYNLRALIRAELMDAGYKKSYDFNLAFSDLEVARQLHPSTSFLYKGTEAFLNKAIGKSAAARSALHKARKALEGSIERVTLIGETTEFIPSSLFWKKGLSVPAYHPPRPDQLKKRWNELEAELTKGKK
jgi:tetratricopeptide (TPR) repeat protein